MWLVLMDAGESLCMRGEDVASVAVVRTLVGVLAPEGVGGVG